MKQKPLIIAILLLIAGFSLGQFFHLPEMVAKWKPESKAGSAAKNTAGKILYWTCGMHPQIREDKPGNCPICAMKLTPVRESASGHEEHENDDGTVTIDAATVQNMGVRTAAVTHGPLERSIRAVGTIEVNERSLSSINSKVEGWIEKVHVQETGAFVKKGQPLYDIYSPDLVSAQQDYLLALDSGSAKIRAAVKTRLKFWDIPDSEIERLARTREIQKTLTVNAPVSGYIVDRMAQEGSSVMMGADLFKIADLSEVWVMASFYENETPFLSVGQDADMTLSYLPGKIFRGRLDYIYPTLDPMTRDIRARLVFANPDLLLKPGMFANVTLKSRIADHALLIPEEAVIRTGVRDVVFVQKGKGRYAPRDVKLGPAGDKGMTQVLEGLSGDEAVVVSSQFLLDSESRLRRAASDGTAAPGAHNHGASAPEAKSRPSAKNKSSKKNSAAWPDPARGKYVCPMEEDNYYYDEPGKCPKCGMTLVETQSLQNESHQH
jgi:multidrug efflux pump subunit AcrA (membrane-fusion protein)